MDRNLIATVSDRLTKEAERWQFADVSAVLKIQHGNIVGVEISSRSKYRPDELQDPKRQ